jgi:hypothetical protein
MTQARRQLKAQSIADCGLRIFGANGNPEREIDQSLIAN